MKKVSLILDKLLAIAKDVKVWFRVLVLVITGFAGAILFSKTKVKTNDCTSYQEQVKILSQTLEQVSKAVDALAGAKTTSFTGMETVLSFASYRDTASPFLWKSTSVADIDNNLLRSLIGNISGNTISNGTVYPVWLWPDTTKRPLTQSQQQVILKDLKKKLDSAKWKVDSINRSQQKQIPQTKT